MKSDKASITKLNKIGIALSKEKNIDALLEMIVVGCKELTNADAGTLYLVIADSHLKFEIVHTDSLDYAMGGTTGVPINFPFIPLYKDGEPNLRMVAAYAVLKDQAVNIEDAYESEAFDFSGTKEFDEQTGYRSTSFLTIPMKDHNEEIIGAIQLINAIDPDSSQIVPFSDDDLHLTESLTSQAAVALSRKKLEDSLRQYVDLHKVINSILMASWEKEDLHSQFQQVLSIILDIPTLAFENGGVFIQIPESAQKLSPSEAWENSTSPENGQTATGESMFLQHNMDAQAETLYAEFCQSNNYISHEVIYLDDPLQNGFDHLVIPLVHGQSCVGVIFLQMEREERLSWEKELFLLSATEPVATILARRFKEMELSHRNQEQQQLLGNITERLENAIDDWPDENADPNIKETTNSSTSQVKQQLSKLLNDLRDH